MAIPILQQGRNLIATVQSAVSDEDLRYLQDELARRVGDARATGVVVDVTLIDVMDSFTIRTLLEIAHVSELRGAAAVIVGIQPEVAFAMVQLGLQLTGVTTGLDLDEGLEILERRVSTNGH